MPEKNRSGVPFILDMSAILLCGRGINSLSVTLSHSSFTSSISVIFSSLFPSHDRPLRAFHEIDECAFDLNKLGFDVQLGG